MKQKILLGIIAGLVVIGIIFISGCVQDKIPTEAPTTPLETPAISCRDSLGCPSQMKCENSVCVDVGCVGEGRRTPIVATSPEGIESLKHMATECCEGLKEIPHPDDFDEKCSLKLVVGVIGTGPVCSNCGNGICENWESKCNCPEDCPAVECTITCGACEALNIEKCVCEPVTPCCDNGVCEAHENWYNCPEDCKEETCVGEGETYMPGEGQCCAGLEAMTITYGDGTTCTLPMGYVCTAFCGDRKCEGEYENACSCPEDCK